MGTRTIDTIQSEQITQLQADVDELRDVYADVVADVQALAPKLAPIISNLNNFASAIKNNYSPSGSTSPDGLLKRLTEFDDKYGTHISRKFPPVVDIKGAVHVGFHINNTPVKHAHPEGWTGSSGTCLTATVTKNPNYPSSIANGWRTNVKFVPLSYNAPDVPTNQTWAGLRLWDAMPTARLYISGSSISSDFALDIFASNNPLNKNCSYGFGKSVNDQMMSGFGGTYSGVWQSGFFATVTSVGSQLEAKPPDNATTGFIGRTPHLPTSAYNINDYAGASPGQGGPAEVADWGEGGSHNIVRDSEDFEGEQYDTTVENAEVLLGYKGGMNVLFMEDPSKIKRAKKLAKQTLNRLRK